MQFQVARMEGRETRGCAPPAACQRGGVGQSKPPKATEGQGKPVWNRATNRV